MNAQRADTSDRYEKVDGNVFRLKSIGRRPRRKILTPFGQKVFLWSGAAIAAFVLLYVFLK